MRVFVLLIVLLSLCGTGLYMVKRSIDARYAELARLRADIRAEQDNHAILQAEWAWLSRPDRIMRLSGNLLEMAPIDANRILPIEAIPMRRSSQTPSNQTGETGPASSPKGLKKDISQIEVLP
jgi:cell division protein FtsL